SLAKGSPFKLYSIFPSVKGICPDRHFNKVDLPEPLLPVTAIFVKGGMRRSTLLKIHSYWNRFPASDSLISSMMSVDVAFHQPPFRRSDKIDYLIPFLGGRQVDFYFL